MKQLLTTTFFLLLCFLDTHAQDLSGKVFDKNNEGIFFANVVLYNAVDSSIVKAVSTDEGGAYSFKNIEDGNYYIEASMLSFTNERISNIQIPGYAGRTNFILREDASLLETVTIKARKPLLEQKADRLVVNVAENLTSINGNLLDVMKKVPGMLVINDRLSMAGQSNVTILINGKSTRYMDVQSLLQEMPGDNIEKVEVIHQPGAEFEASGSGPIINIILKKNVFLGTNGTARAGIEKNHIWKYNGGVSLSHHQGKLNIQTGLGYNQNAYREIFTLKRSVGSDIYDQRTVEPADPRSYRANLTLDYDLSDRQRIGVGNRFVRSDAEFTTTSTTNIDFLTADDYTLVTDNVQKRDWTFYSINPYYGFDIDTAGQKLNLDVNIARFKINSANELMNSNTSEDVVFLGQRYEQPGDTKIFAAKLDYTKPLSDALVLKTGLKYSLADLDNNLSAFDEDGNSGAWVINTLQSNHYQFTEDISAAYGKLDWKFGEWNGTAGLRYEKSVSEGYSVTLDSTLDRTIEKLFPSLSASRKLVGPLAANIAYSYRIDRPRYSTLNPFVYYYDPFTYEKGNPNLRPELTHSTKFSISADGQPFFNLEYKRSKDVTVQVTEQDDDTGEANRVSINMDSRQIFDGSLFFPMDIVPGVAGGYAGVIVNYLKFDSQYLGLEFNPSKWSTTVVVQAEFNLPWEINASAGGWYNSGVREGIIDSEWLYGTNIGFSKKFWDNNAKFSIGAEDLLNRFWDGRVDFANMDLDIHTEWYAPQINAQFSYKFGNRHIKNKKRLGGGANEEVRRANQN